MKAILILTILLTSHLNLFFVKAQLIAPQYQSEKYSIKAGELYFEVDPSYGGRITSFKHKDKEILYLERPEKLPFVWGSTLWDSPQSNWGWPPAPELDNQPYKHEILENQLKLTSNIDPLSGLQFIKTFYAFNNQECIYIDYSLVNHSEKTIERSAWEVTRVPAGGITFFPAGEGIVSSNGEQETTEFSQMVETQDNIRWYECKPTNPKGSKFYSTGKEGWLAHLNQNRILFVKEFQNKNIEMIAPFEKEIEIYLNSFTSFIELENQSEYKSLAPGDTLTYRVRWMVQELPEEVDFQTKNKKLVELVRGQISRYPF